MPPQPHHLQALRDYSEGKLGTREAIECAGLDDYADLLIAMVQYDLPFPRPDDTPARAAHIARATEILQPLLRHGR